MNRSVFRMALASGVLLTSLAAQADLVDRGGGLIYDTDLDVTWLSNPNLAEGSAFDDGDSTTDGRMTLPSALTWVAALDFAGYSDWRLPHAPMRDATCSNDNGEVNYVFGCTGNEMGHLFYSEFGATAMNPVSASGSPYLALFSPIADHAGASGYWIDSPWCCSNFPGFVFADGELVYTVAQNQYYAWAVRDGDSAPVPAPSSAALLALGLVVVSAASMAQRTFIRSK